MKNIDFTDFFNVFLSGATIRETVFQNKQADRNLGMTAVPDTTHFHLAAYTAGDKRFAIMR